MDHKAGRSLTKKDQFCNVYSTFVDLGNKEPQFVRKIRQTSQTSFPNGDDQVFLESDRCTRAFL